MWRRPAVQGFAPLREMKSGQDHFLRTVTSTAFQVTAPRITQKRYASSLPYGWHSSQPLACVAAGAEWRRAPLLHETVELEPATGVGIAARARTCGGPRQPNQ